MEKINIKGINEEIYYEKCDNGLKVFMWVNEKVKTTMASLSVKYGSIHTEFKVGSKKIKVPNGTAHFLEHLKFNEKTGSAHDYFTKNGADANAFTTFEYTSYYFYTLANLNDNLMHLLDFVETPYFNKSMISKEKGIIIEESNMGKDNPDMINYFGIYNNLFTESKYRFMITGEKEEIKSVCLDDILNVYNNFYHPENMFLCVTGNFNPYEIMKLVKDNQAKKSFSPYTKPEIINVKEPNKVNKEYSVDKYNIQTPKAKVALKIPKSCFKEFDDFDLRAMLKLILNINFDNTSLFKESLLEDNLITEMYTNFDINDNYVVLIVSFESDYIEEAIKLIKDKFANLEINNEDFTRKKNVAVATLILGFDDVENVNTLIQDNLILYDKIIDDIKERYENINYKNTKKVLDKISNKNETTFVMMPK